MINFRYFLQVMLCDLFDLLYDVKSANRSKVDIVPMIRKFYQRGWFVNQSASWNSHFEPAFTEVIARRGYGSTFNMLPQSELFTNQ
jgi:hypothetical protein